MSEINEHNIDQLFPDFNLIEGGEDVRELVRELLKLINEYGMKHPKTIHFFDQNFSTGGIDE